MRGELGIILFILALTLAIFLHEGGHFLTAKWFGMKVERFFLGFGPTIWSFRRGETEYGIKAIPAGGFCKIAGMSPYEHDGNLLEEGWRRPGDPPPEPVAPERQFRNKPAWQRAIVLAAGSITHFIAALLLIFLLLTVIGRPSDETTNVIQEVVAEADDGTPAPAGQAGLRAGDRVVAVDGKPVADFRGLRAALAGTQGRRIQVVYERDGQRRTTSLVPASVADGSGGRRAFLGVQPTSVIVHLNPLEAIPATGASFGRITGASFVGLGSIVTGLVDRLEPQRATGGGSGSGDGGTVGVVGLGRLAGQAAAAQQWIFFVILLIQFNVVVGIINLLPIPPMDGGYLAFLAKEKVTGRPVDLRRVAPVAALIVGLLVTLTVGLVWLDITNPIGNPFK
ncbi:MAG TPA: RIP metalloprotease [Actinomycetes bacterium]|nr:RIP metalloprotease [Actinomycetes bacterium]